MAARLAFHYSPGRSWLHRWDARCKAVGMLLLGGQLLHAPAHLLALHSFLLLSMAVHAGISWRGVVRDLRSWSVLLLVIFLAHLLVPSPPPAGSGPGSYLDSSRLLAGAMPCWRFTLVLLAAVLFVATTRPRELRAALLWLLQPLPGLPAERLGFMAGLALRLLPLVFDEFEEVTLAVRARLGTRRRQPWQAARQMAFTMLRRTFARADELAYALAARGYREDLRVPAAPLVKTQWMPVIFLGGLWAAAAAHGWMFLEAPELLVGALGVLSPFPPP
jgi:energy-coupling factor transporter transmembrane protein EcfT